MPAVIQCYLRGGLELCPSGTAAYHNGGVDSAILRVGNGAATGVFMVKRKSCLPEPLCRMTAVAV